MKKKIGFGKFSFVSVSLVNFFGFLLFVFGKPKILLQTVGTLNFLQYGERNPRMTKIKEKKLGN